MLVAGRETSSLFVSNTRFSFQSHLGLRAVAHLWQEFVLEMRYRWDRGILIPRYGTLHCQGYESFLYFVFYLALIWLLHRIVSLMLLFIFISTIVSRMIAQCSWKRLNVCDRRLFTIKQLFINTNCFTSSISFPSFEMNTLWLEPVFNRLLSWIFNWQRFTIA